MRVMIEIDLCDLFFKNNIYLTLVVSCSMEDGLGPNPDRISIGYLGQVQSLRLLLRQLASFGIFKKPDPLIANIRRKFGRVFEGRLRYV